MPLTNFFHDCFADRLLAQLSNGKYSFPDDTFLLWKKGGKAGKSGSGSGRNRFCVASRRDIVQEAKERFCKFADRANLGAGGAAFSADEEQGKDIENRSRGRIMMILINSTE